MLGHFKHDASAARRRNVPAGRRSFAAEYKKEVTIPILKLLFSFIAVSPFTLEFVCC